MRILHAMIALACLAISAVCRPFVIAVERIASLVPMFADPRAALSLDHGHPRSPLASLRAGLA